MFDPETVAFLEAGCGLIVATVGPDGEPIASRGWGLTVTAPDTGEIRLLLDASEAIAIATLEPGAAIAITGGDVRTLRSMQCKGRSVRVLPATDSDRTRANKYCGEFITAVSETDGTDPEKITRLVPDDYVVCVARVETLYNQTPGPAAGESIAVDAAP